jgi:hypothetical protein
MVRIPLPVLVALAGIGHAQNRAVVPPVASALPGNAAISMPLRWSEGTMQVLVEATLLPVNLVGHQVTGLRLRRPAFLREPGYPSLVRTLTVRACFTPAIALQFGSSRAANIAGTTGLQVVAGPTAFTIAATSPPAAPNSLGDEFLAIPFAVPLPAAAGSLFVEIEAHDAPLAAGAHWVDAVWMPGGVDRGYAVPVGDGACTTGAAPLELQWAGASGPVRGSDATLLLSGAPAAAVVFAWIGLAPQLHANGPTFLGYGASLAAVHPALQGCSQWAPIDAIWSGLCDAVGTFQVRFPLPVAATRPGDRIGVQAAVIDLARAGLPLSFGNGTVLVLDDAGVRGRCVTVLFPGSAAVSPWAPYLGLSPVLVIEYV